VTPVFLLLLDCKTPRARRPEMRTVNRLPTLALVSALAALAGCSTVENLLSGDKIDYKSASSAKTSPLEVPPDLTQLQRDPRQQAQGGVVSASTFQTAQPAAGAASAATVAPSQVGDVRVERNDNTRWLVSSQSPEQLWPQIRSFWVDRGFDVAIDNPDAGVMETDWAENRAKLPNDLIRNTIGKVLEGLYSTGERDKFRTRLERTPQGTEIYVSHRRMAEELVTTGGTGRDGTTTWAQRPADPQLEAEMLSRLMVKLGTKEQQARAAVAGAGHAHAGSGPAVPSAPARARVLAGQPGAALQLDEPFDRAWRRVGLALDRSGFTVEDRDRAGGVYYVRYVDPGHGTREKGFFAKLFNKGDDEAKALGRYRIAVKSAGANTTVSVLNNQGAPEAGETGQRIVALLVNDLK